MAKSNLPKVTEFDNSDSQMLWRSAEVIDAGKATYLIIRCQYTDHWGGDVNYRYHFEILACGPKWPLPKPLKSSLDSWGVTLEEYKKWCLDGKLQFLVDSGLTATLWTGTGNNLKALLRQARQELIGINCLFGFYMDRNQNAIGDTGWDWIRGDLCASIRRMKRDKAAAE